jgi:Leucine-rich repeat (LRR) protein
MEYLCIRRQDLNGLKCQAKHMTITELKQKLIEAYSVSNLNNISLTLISLFRDQKYSVLQKISEIISDFVDIKITDEGKGFSKFMMLYHPDRAGHHINEIHRLSEQNNFDALLEYSHILKMERIEEIAASLHSYEDIDYAPVYDWDVSTDGFSIVDDRQSSEYVKIKTNTKLIGYSFYDAMKIRESGNTEIEYPLFYLEDIEELELSSSDILDLDGVQYCINAKTIDLSDNRITDLTLFICLKNLEELNLSDNQIGYIDVLSNLEKLRSVRLSNNYIEDISPLFELGKLEYVELSGNKIDIEQINRLTELGITVDFD